jgi:hypothetical protein
MPRAQAPEWRRRKQPVLDDHLRTSITQANGIPDPTNGHYAKVVYAGCPTKERAQEIKTALYRSGRYVKVSVSATVVPAGDGTWQVHFFAIDKTYAKKYMLERYGTVANFPYNPRRKGEH